jgi:hypothetical protein
LVIEKIKQLLGPKRVEALKDLKAVTKGLISGDYKSPSFQIKALERKLNLRAKDYRSLVQKIKDNNAEMALLDAKISALEEQLIGNIFDHAQSLITEEEEPLKANQFEEMEIFDASKYLKK